MKVLTNRFPKILYKVILCVAWRRQEFRKLKYVSLFSPVTRKVDIAHRIITFDKIIMRYSAISSCQWPRLGLPYVSEETIRETDRYDSRVENHKLDDIAISLACLRKRKWNNRPEVLSKSAVFQSQDVNPFVGIWIRFFLRLS